MLEGYLKAALFITPYVEPDGTYTDEYMDARFKVADFTNLAVDRAFRDCSAFRFKHAKLITQIMDKISNKYTMENVGHDFCMSRCEVGSGFMDHYNAHGFEDLNAVFDALHSAAKSFKCVDWEVDDNGRIQQVG